MRRRIEAMIHRGVHALHGQEVSLPAIQPAELWSGAAEHDNLIGDVVSSLRGTVHLGETDRRDLVLTTRHLPCVVPTGRR